MSTTETLAPIDPEPLLTTKQVAAWLSMKENYVYAESAAGRMPSVQIGRYRRFRRSALEAWLDGLGQAA